MPKLKHDDVEIYYEVFGDGVPIVFTPSGNASHSMWDGQIDALSDRFRIVTYDWRGTGQSSRTNGVYSGDTAADDLIRLLEEVVGEPAVRAGHGMGAHVTLLAARKRPDLVRAIILANGAPWYTGERDGVIGGMSQEFFDAVAPSPGQTYADGLGVMVRDWMFTEKPSELLVTALVLDGMSWPTHITNQYDRNMMDIDHRPYLDEITCPVLVIHGRHDKKQHYDGGVYLSQKRPNARLVTLENTTHVGHLEEPDAFNSAIAEFVEEVAPVSR